MRYDLKLIEELCREIGLRSHVRSKDLLAIELGHSVFLCFENLANDGDCLIAFEGTPWHHHGDFMFADGRGYYVEMNYLDVIAELKTGKILVCELWQKSEIKDRWLVHSEYNDELRYLQEGEEIKVRRMN